MKKLLLFSVAISIINNSARTQSLPMEMRFSDDGKMLLIGDLPNTGLYDQSIIRTIHLNFSQPDYWEQLDSLYWTWEKKEIPATMTVDGTTYDSVGVRFKGQSTFQNLPTGSRKKPFSISMDFVHPSQNLMGYKSLNLSNCYDDPSFIREIFYETQIKKHIPAAKASYTKLYINGENWGLYPNLQQLNKTYYKEWYLSSEGTSWRADRPSGLWTPYGDGTSALNYLGADTALYQEQYILKSATRENPWDDMVNTCDVLNNTPLANLSSELPAVLDVDRTLWFLASEILFSDDDSYVQKGRADYYFYWEKETGRFAPQEYDGNTVMKTMFQNWSPFYHADSVNYPLMNRLFAVPEYRQRYLAHLRTLMKECFTSSVADSIIDAYKNQIEAIVQNDPKKIYSYSDFENEISVLKNFITARRISLENNAEVAEVPPTIANVAWYVSGSPWAVPTEMQNVTMRASADYPSGIYRMNLYYSNKLSGNFIKVQMFDDGLHNDLASGDGIYGVTIPGQNAGTWVRFYVEAVANNSAKTVAYEPPGAEHNVYAYIVRPSASADTTVVINEIMAKNSSTAMDEAGEFDDWIELYNKKNDTINISGFSLTDNFAKPEKWKFPQGTVIPPNEYLIVWADDNVSQGPLHANFKISGSGEQLMLLDTSGKLIDSLSFGEQETDMGFARSPNGYGNFKIHVPTFKANNDGNTVEELDTKDVEFSIYPNPNNGNFTLQIKNFEPGGHGIQIFNLLGEIAYQAFSAESLIQFDISNFENGIYFLQINNKDVAKKSKLIVMH